MKSLSAIQLDNKPELIVDEIDIADPIENQVMIKVKLTGFLFLRILNNLNSDYLYSFDMFCRLNL